MFTGKNVVKTRHTKYSKKEYEKQESKHEKHKHNDKTLLRNLRQDEKELKLI